MYERLLHELTQKVCLVMATIKSKRIRKREETLLLMKKQQMVKEDDHI